MMRLSKLPHLTVAAVVKQADRYLVVEEFKNGQRVINQPAGHVEDGESLIEAVKRETLEETGYLIDVHALLGIYRYFAKSNQTHYVRVCFIATAIKQVSDQLDADIDKINWLTKAQLTARKHQLRSPLVLENIEDFENGQTFSLEVIK